MRIFLDTEFTDFIDCEMISIGMVSEDGQREFYAEVSDFDRGKCNPYVRANIVPLLGRPLYSQQSDSLIKPLILPRGDVTSHLRQWFVALPRSVTIACDSEIDWALLLDALEERPANIAGRYDLRTLIDTSVFHHAVLEYHANPCRPWHHALHDARAHRAGWLAYMDARKNRR